MRILVWQWGRFGAMPRFAMLLAEALRSAPATNVTLSLSTNAELLNAPDAPHCDLPFDTYKNLRGYAQRLVNAPFITRKLAHAVADLRPDLAICVHPGPLDLIMANALRRLRIPFVALVHDAELHPGDGNPIQMWLQRRIYRRAAAIGALTSFVAKRLVAQKLAGGRAPPLIQLTHPPVTHIMPSSPKRVGGPFHLLMFGRLLPYKGLDLLADALQRLGPRPDLLVRVVGAGPQSAALQTLGALPGVIIENRWVPEHEIGALLAWSDGVVLPYREASQSGVVAAAVAAGRSVIATRVGGLPEQLAGVPNAILCDPDPTKLAGGLQQLLELPSAFGHQFIDATAEWQKMGSSLLQQIDTIGIFRAD